MSERTAGRGLALAPLHRGGDARTLRVCIGSRCVPWTPPGQWGRSGLLLRQRRGLQAAGPPGAPQPAGRSAHRQARLPGSEAARPHFTKIRLTLILTLSVVTDEGKNCLGISLRSTLPVGVKYSFCSS